MAKRIKAGSLVCMSKRNVKGLGIVLERVKDINQRCDFDLSDAWRKLYDTEHEDYFFKDSNQFSLVWHERRDVKNAIISKILDKDPSIDEEMITEFWAWNCAYRIRRTKTGLTPRLNIKVLEPCVDFSLVLWTKPPSNYDSQPATAWKNKSIWTFTRSLNNA